MYSPKYFFPICGVACPKRTNFSQNLLYAKTILGKRLFSNWIRICNNRRAAEYQWRSLHQTCHKHAKKTSLYEGKTTTSLYQILKVDQKSTQQEIKDAYYKLSLLYHPDMNKGSEQAALKFREINEAYEILGNHSSRKKYDRGLLQYSPGFVVRESPSSGEEGTTDVGATDTKKKNPYTVRTGRSTVYDYDAWTRAHYSETFQKRQEMKKEGEYQERDLKSRKEQGQVEILIMMLFFTIMVAYSLIALEDSDVPPKPGEVKNEPVRKN